MRWTFAGFCGLFAVAEIAGCSSAAGESAPTLALPVAAPASCGGGTMPSLASGACEAVGPTSCPNGFTPAGDGWGCTATVPAAACTGATRATLGKTECVPVDDCDAPFPPTGAKVVHDSAELAAELAVAPLGAKFALESGNYGPITTDQDVTLVGRCASKVIVKGPGTRGVLIQQDRKVTLRSMTITGFQAGIVAYYFNPRVEISNVVLSKNQIGIVAGEASVKISQSVIEGRPGTAAADAAVTAQLGAKIALDDVDVRDAGVAFAAYDSPGAVDVRRSVVTYNGPAREARLVLAYRGGTVTITESTLRTREAGFAALGTDLEGLPPAKVLKPGSLHVVASEIVQRGLDRRERGLVLIGAGATALFEGTTLVHQSDVAVLAGEPGSAATFTDSVIRAEPTSDLQRWAVSVLRGASSTLTRTAVVDAYQNALLVGHQGSRITLDHALVTNTKFGGPGPAAELGGVGMAIGVSDGGSLITTDSAVVASEQFAILGDGDARLELTRTLIDGTKTTGAGLGGFGVAATNGAQLFMDASAVRGSAEAALMFLGSQAIVQSSRFSANKVGVQLQGVALIEAKERPRTSVAEQVVFFSNLFENNVTYSTTTPVDVVPWNVP